MARNRSSRSPFMGGKQGAPLRAEDERVAPDYELPLETPPAKEVAAGLRKENLVLSLKAVPEPVVEIFLDQLPAFKGKDQACFVFMITRGKKYLYYKVPFSLVVPMLHWVKLSQEKRPRWHLHLVPDRHKLVGRNGPRVENIDIAPYYNKC